MTQSLEGGPKLTELATAYVSIVAEASGVPRVVKSALGQAEGEADTAGRRMGSRMATALGATLKAGGVAAARTASLAVGTALTKGFERLTAIDNAKSKLAGLGHTTQSTAKIMDSAVASVKGTAFGLGDAATVAATAVAAGVKPGQDLTKYLTMTADAATIAGAGLDEIGGIMNGVQTSGTAMNDSLGQLAGRGLPILQWIGKEMGVTADQVSELASKGKVSSEIFFKAIQNNIGGAALSSGKTVQGSFKNMIAALGRLGAAVEEPGFNRLPGFFMSTTAAIDSLTPKAKELATAFDGKMFDEWIPKAQKALAELQSSGDLGDVTGVFAGIGDAVTGVAPSLGQIVTALGQASAALGISGWQLFLTVLQASAGVLNAVTPLLSGLAGLMSSNQAAVTALVGAWLAFKTVPAILGRVGAATTPLATRITAATTATTGFGTSWRQTTQWMRQGNPQLSAAGASMRLLGAAASTGAAAGISKLSNAAKGAMGVLGGPWGAALAGAGIATMLVMSKNQKSTAALEAYDAATKDAASSQNDLNVALMKSRGAVTDDVFSEQQKHVEDLQEQLDATSKKTGSFLDMFRGADAGSDGSSVANALHDRYKPDESSRNDQLNQMATEAKEVQKRLTDLGYVNETLTKSVYGSDGAFGQLIGTLKNSDGTFKSEAAKNLAQSWRDARREFEQQQEAAKKVVPGISELGDAFRIMGDKSASAADKLKALKTAMDVLNPARGKAEALAQYGETIRNAAEGIPGIGKDAFNKGGQLDTFTESGRKLKDVLVGIADSTSAIIANGDMADIGRTAAENTKTFEALALQTGKSVTEIRALYGSFGGDANDIIIKLKGDTDLTQKVGLIQLALKKAKEEGREPIIAKDTVAGMEGDLKNIGILVHDLKDGTVRLEVTGDARKKIDLIVAAMSKVPPGKAVEVSAPGGADIVSLLELMGVHVNKANKKNIEVTSPTAPWMLDLLKKIGLEVVDGPDGKKIIVTADDKDYQTKKTDWSNPIHKRLILEAGLPTGPNNLNSPNVGRGGSAHDRNANGSIRQYVDGGISAVEAYANGGARLPDRALIQKADPRGGLVQWAEPSTKGEAFIPLAAGKRPRSTSILATVADMFGYQLVDKSAPDGISGWAGALAAAGAKSLAMKAGMDGVTKFADGGLHTPAEFLQLAQGGFGASRSLQGAPYVPGGVNWGDCSGAMSAFARFAAGLDVFGGRFATASQAAALQAMGAVMGLGGAGTMRFGWYNGGPGGGHTAGTLPDGTNVEMGGGNGGGAIGGSVGADNPMFTDHAYFPAAAAATGGDSPTGGDYSGSGGDYSGDRNLDPDDSGGGTTTTTASKDNSLSGRLGDVAKAFVSGQVSSLFEVLSVNDQPGWLAAITEYENQQQSAGDGGGDGDNPKLSASQKLAIKQQYESDKLTRKQTFDNQILELENKHRLKKLSDADFENQKLALTQKHENEDLRLEQEYKRKIGNPASYSSLSLKQDFARKKLARGQQFDRDKLALDNQLKAKTISQESHDSQLAVLKNKLAADDLAAQHEYERAKTSGSQNFNRMKLQKKGDEKTHLGDDRQGGRRKVRDPGTQKPGKDEDLPLPKLFDRGGSFGPGLNLVENKLGKPETGLPFSPDELKRSLDGGNVGNVQVLAKLTQIAELLRQAPRGNVNYNLPADRGVQRAEKIADSRRRAGLPA